jgi:hypothetical protein
VIIDDIHWDANWGINIRCYQSKTAVSQLLFLEGKAVSELKAEE